ncbi:hypothetical protein E1265_31180 [Streptomyces sp. 8K308]|uniref:hypothetical protein n=1 Tax=Streptomyces sp. 8K308 TaxID=2530388 RepID=UPI00104EAFE1|nr:hypothetical protein [Streptomyces sp. 8K308]TDC10501.1 hypothetical protein E1265_31180 [Streptomyces sp. 8K308]
MDPAPDVPEAPEIPEAADVPQRPAARDPFAVALANASLLGAGYLMLRRWRLALGNAAVTAILVTMLASGAEAGWLRATVVPWWLFGTAHGWYLARRVRGERRGGVRRQRLVAAGTALPVLAALVALRVDASGIERDSAEAHRAGDCARALSTLDGLWAGHRVADPRLAARAEDAVEACELLLRADRLAGGDRLLAEQTLEGYEAHPGARWEGAGDRRAELVLAEAADELDTALTGDTEALATGFDHLATVLGEFPGQEDAVGAVMDGFLDGLPAEDACETRQITDWLGDRPGGGDVLDRAAEVVPRIAPAAIVGCGDDAMADYDWSRARERYRQLLDQYPDHELAAEAEAGVERAETAIELDRLRELVSVASPDEQPAYCDGPEPYRGADPYRGGGPHRALLFGNGGHADDLPSSWLADNADEAVLVICVGDREQGRSVETCAYESGGLSPFGYQDVTFHEQRFPVRVYEVRTGRRVDVSNVSIGGASCPEVLEYEYYGYVDPGPPSDEYVDSSEADVRAAYEPLINP